MIRSDIREDPQGIPLTLTITVVNSNAACAPVVGADVEVWHADVAGNYSEYSTERSKTYLRGVQTTDANGQVVFTTIYPGWYQGRATHIQRSGFSVHRSGSRSGSRSRSGDGSRSGSGSSFSDKNENENEN